MADVVSAREFKKEGEEYEMHKESSSVPENPRTRRRVDQGDGRQIVIAHPLAVGFHERKGEGRGLGRSAHTQEQRGILGHYCLLFSETGAQVLYDWVEVITRQVHYR